MLVKFVIPLGIVMIMLGTGLLAFGLSNHVKTNPIVAEDCEVIDDAVLKAYVAAAPADDDTDAAITYAARIRDWAKVALPEGCQRNSYIKWADASERNARGALREYEQQQATHDQAVQSMLNSGKIVLPPNSTGTTP